MCGILAAASPFLATYANETRMYSLMALLCVLVTATFLHAFFYRRRRLVPVFALLLAMTLYTHYWGLFLALGTGAALVLCFVGSDDRRRLAIDAALAYGGAALLFAPWVPTLLYQRSHTAIGWALPPPFSWFATTSLGWWEDRCRQSPWRSGPELASSS